jgi:hypothetical protein
VLDPKDHLRGAHVRLGLGNDEGFYGTSIRRKRNSAAQKAATPIATA